MVGNNVGGFWYPCQKVEGGLSVSCEPNVACRENQARLSLSVLVDATLEV